MADDQCETKRAIGKTCEEVNVVDGPRRTFCLYCQRKQLEGPPEKRTVRPLAIIGRPGSALPGFLKRPADPPMALKERLELILKQAEIIERIDNTPTRHNLELTKLIVSNALKDVAAAIEELRKEIK